MPAVLSELKRYRKSVDLSVNELSRVSGVPANSILLAENAGEVDFVTAKKLASALGLNSYMELTFARPRPEVEQVKDVNRLLDMIKVEPLLPRDDEISRCYSDSEMGVAEPVVNVRYPTTLSCAIVAVILSVYYLVFEPQLFSAQSESMPYWPVLAIISAAVLFKFNWQKLFMVRSKAAAKLNLFDMDYQSACLYKKDRLNLISRARQGRPTAVGQLGKALLSDESMFPKNCNAGVALLAMAADMGDRRSVAHLVEYFHEQTMNSSFRKAEYQLDYRSWVGVAQRRGIYTFLGRGESRVPECESQPSGILLARQVMPGF